MEYLYKIILIPSVQLLENKIKNISNNCTVIKIEHDIGMFEYNMTIHQKIDLFISGYNQVKNTFSK